MTRLRHRRLPLVILIAATGLLVASIALTPWAGPGSVPGGITMSPGMGPGMGGVAIAGDGPVNDLDQARRSAQRFADRWGLTVGEVMQFDNGFYAELAEPSGDLATETLIDPGTGAVGIEFGPAMMWNTAYGMHVGRGAAATDTVASAEQAQTIANGWLAANRSGERAGEADRFPGYYTLHILTADQVTGMLSVHAGTGAVWYHAWHGRFIAMSEADAN